MIEQLHNVVSVASLTKNEVTATISTSDELVVPIFHKQLRLPHSFIILKLTRMQISRHHLNKFNKNRTDFVNMDET